MRTNKDKKKLLISVVIGLAATLIVYSQFQNQTHEIEKLQKEVRFFQDNLNSESYNYVVAKSDLKRGTVLTREMLTTKNYTLKITGTYENIGDLENKVLLKDLKTGDLLNSNAINATMSFNGYNVPKGMRTITVPTSSIQGFASFLKEGMRVDIISTAREDGNSNKSAIVGVIIQNVEILSFETNNGDKTKTENITAITFKVPAGAVNKIVNAMQGGQLMLATRGLDDSIGTPSSHIESVPYSYKPSYKVSKKKISYSSPQYYSKLPNLPAYNESIDSLPAPAAPVIKQEKVEMIQANVKSEVNFSN